MIFLIVDLDRPCNWTAQITLNFFFFLLLRDIWAILVIDGLDNKGQEFFPALAAEKLSY